MAVPNPERELARLEKLLKAKEPARAIFVVGPARFFREEAVEMALARIPADAELRRIDGGEPTDGRELDDLRGAGLFGSGTWLCVRRAEKWLDSVREELAGLLPKIGAGCGLLLEAQKLDRRTKAGKALAAAAEVFEFRELYSEPYDRARSPLEAESVGWIEKRARKLGLALMPEAAFLVQTVVGSDPAEIVPELRRIRDAVGDARRNLGPDDLRQHLHVAFESTPFELAEAVLSGDRARAMRSAAAVFERGVRTRDGGHMDPGGVFPFVVSWLWQSLAKALAGRRLLDAGMRPADVAGRVGVRTFIERFVAQVEGNPAPRLERGLELLLQAQRDLRSTGESPRWILERFLAGYFRGVEPSRGPAERYPA